MTFKLIIVIISFITLNTFSILFLIDKDYCSSFNLFLTSLIFIRLLCIELVDSINDNCIQIISGFILCISLFQSVSNSSLLDLNSSKKNYDIIIHSVNINYCTENEQPNKIKRDLFNSQKDKLIQKCALQNIQNGTKLAIDLSKTLYLNPAAGAADSIYNKLNPDHKITCQELNTYLDKLCPGAMYRP